ncbi:MAG: hypothetical protein QE510_12785, partial [Verrucomicrobiota bacterium]|nr:hypothetical protein [Verrucomicrobiota bacterium]
SGDWGFFSTRWPSTEGESTDGFTLRDMPAEPFHDCTSPTVDCRFRATPAAGAGNSILLQPLASGLSGGGAAALGSGPCSTP